MAGLPPGPNNLQNKSQVSLFFTQECHHLMHRKLPSGNDLMTIVGSVMAIRLGRNNLENTGKQQHPLLKSLPQNCTYLFTTLIENYLLVTFSLIAIDRCLFALNIFWCKCKSNCGQEASEVSPLPCCESFFTAVYTCQTRTQQDTGVRSHT